MTRPLTGADPGWPRPRQQTIPTLADAALQGERGRALPVPWVARSDPDEGWMPAAYDSSRSTRMITHDLCQVCGGPRGATVYVVAGQDDFNGSTTRVPQSGGALCSERCARLTAAVCPHYREQWPAHVYAIPHCGDRVAIGTMRDLDDYAHIDQEGAVLVAVVGEARDPARSTGHG